MSKGLTVVVWLLVMLAPGSSDAQTCDGARPEINKPGFRPNATIRYAVAPSPRGEPFPPEQLACVWRAFQAWTDVNEQSALRVRFAPGPGGVVVRYDDPWGMLPRDAAGGWTGPVRGADGSLEGAEILLSPRASVLNRCDGVTKAVLHELGHLHGLADRMERDGLSVMNDNIRRDDGGGRIPLRPTACDGVQARLASPVQMAASAGLPQRLDEAARPEVTRQGVPRR